MGGGCRWDSSWRSRVDGGDMNVFANGWKKSWRNCKQRSEVQKSSGFGIAMFHGEVGVVQITPPIRWQRPASDGPGFCFCRLPNPQCSEAHCCSKTSKTFRKANSETFHCSSVHVSSTRVSHTLITLHYGAHFHLLPPISSQSSYYPSFTLSYLISFSSAIAG